MYTAAIDHSISLGRFLPDWLSTKLPLERLVLKGVDIQMGFPKFWPSNGYFASALKWFGAGPLVLQFVCFLCGPAYAQGDTGPPGLEGLDEAFVLLVIYPFLAIGISFLIFKATGKAWVFFLAPFLMVGLSVIGPVELMAKSAPSPAFLVQFGIWAYGAHILAVAIVYSIFRRTKKGWLFILAPIVGWMIQFISLLFIFS